MMKKSLTLILFGQMLFVACGHNFGSATKPDAPHYSKDEPYASRSAFSDAVLETRDDKTQITVQVSNDGHFIRALGADNKVLWEKDVIKQFGQPAEGPPYIHKVSTKFETVDVLMGDHTTATYDLPTGDFREFDEKK
jgi:hypothetical protein